MFVRAGKKYFFPSELWLKKRERKKNHCLGALRHPFFMVLQRAAPCPWEKVNLQTKQRKKGEAEGGVVKQAGKQQLTIKGDVPVQSHPRPVTSEGLHPVQ